MHLSRYLFTEARRHDRFTQKKVAFYMDRLPARKTHEGIWSAGKLVPLWYDVSEYSSHQIIVCADGSGIFEHWPDVDGIRFLDPRPSESNGKDLCFFRDRARKKGPPRGTCW